MRDYKKSKRFDWKASKQHINEIAKNKSLQKLDDYVTAFESNMNDTRIGQITLQVNSYEYALLTQKLRDKKSKSFRDLFFELIRESKKNDCR